MQEEAQHHHANKEEHKQDAAQHKDGAGNCKNLDPLGDDVDILERTATHLLCSNVRHLDVAMRTVLGHNAEEFDGSFFPHIARCGSAAGVYV